MKSDETVLVVLKMLMLAYPNAQVGVGTIDLYISQLSDIPVSALRKSALKHIRVSKWFPTIAELRSHYDPQDSDSYFSEVHE